MNERLEKETKKEMKTITIWKEGNNLGSRFRDGDRTISWEDLSREEREDLVYALYQFADFFDSCLDRERQEQ